MTYIVIDQRSKKHLLGVTHGKATWGGSEDMIAYEISETPLCANFDTKKGARNAVRGIERSVDAQNQPMEAMPSIIRY
ncbi:MAG: hypothetical protein WC796_06125 [Candidatus Pacearchaeota archaeon]|jgi:hypothetical protein